MKKQLFHSRLILFLVCSCLLSLTIKQDSYHPPVVTVEYYHQEIVADRLFIALARCSKNRDACYRNIPFDRVSTCIQKTTLIEIVPTGVLIAEKALVAELQRKQPSPFRIAWYHDVIQIHNLRIEKQLYHRPSEINCDNQQHVTSPYPT